MVEVQLNNGRIVYVKYAYDCQKGDFLEAYCDEELTSLLKELPYTHIPDQTDYNMEDPCDRLEWETEWDTFVDLLSEELC